VIIADPVYGKVVALTVTSNVLPSPFVNISLGSEGAAEAVIKKDPVGPVVAPKAEIATWSKNLIFDILYT
jgi:hypothetical protein